MHNGTVFEISERWKVYGAVCLTCGMLVRLFERAAIYEILEEIAVGPCRKLFKVRGPPCRRPCAMWRADKEDTMSTYLSWDFASFAIPQSSLRAGIHPTRNAANEIPSSLP